MLKLLSYPVMSVTRRRSTVFRSMPDSPKLGNEFRVCSCQ